MEMAKTVKELRLELGRRHLRKSGVKAVVHARLRAALLNEDWEEFNRKRVCDERQERSDDECRTCFVGEKEFLDLTVKELRVELGKNNLLKKGRKAELQERLRVALLDDHEEREYTGEMRQRESSSENLGSS